MTRIIIIGNGGTGKSTLGEKLGKILNLQVTHLDKMTYNPGWIRVDEDVFRKKLNDIISKENWIVEGWSYHSTLRLRLEASTIIIYLKHSIFICYWNALLRHIKYFYRQNPYDPDDSPILKKTSKMVKAMWKVYKVYEPELQDMLKQFERSKKVLVFEKRQDLNKFVRKLELTKDINHIDV
ncbi:MAG: hypothetical protein ABI840_12165 [bacterium]